MLELATLDANRFLPKQLNQDVITIQDDDVNVKRQTKKKKVQKVRLMNLRREHLASRWPS